jgi:cell division septal protein FtsQ
MSVSAPADKRFRRPSVRPKQQRGLTRALRWPVLRGLAAAGLLLGLVYAAAFVVSESAVFRVNRVTVRGNSRLSTGEVLALVSDLKGDSVLTANLGVYRTRLVDSPWVADATLRRVLPGSVEITLRERAPIGLCRLLDRLYLVDATGTVIDEFGPQYADLDLPIIDGLSGAPRPGAPTIDQGRAELAAEVVRAISGHRGLARRVSQIDVRDARDAVVILDGETALLHLGDSHFAERLQSYLDLAPALHERVPDIDYVDLRFDERVYVRPAKARKE